MKILTCLKKENTMIAYRCQSRKLRIFYSSCKNQNKICNMIFKFWKNKLSSQFNKLQLPKLKLHRTRITSKKEKKNTATIPFTLSVNQTSNQPGVTLKLKESNQSKASKLSKTNLCNPKIYKL